MKKIFILFATAVSIIASGADIILPPAEKKSGMSLAEALNMRRSIRRFTDRKLSTQELANILWSANGVTRPDGKRTAPSALNRQEIMLYVTMEEGTFFYDPAAHILKKVCSEDLRKYAGKYTAPCYIILVADLAKQPRENFASIDAGYVSQNIYLAATAQKLGTCAIGSISDRQKLAEKIISGKKMLILVHSLGSPAK